MTHFNAAFVCPKIMPVMGQWKKNLTQAIPKLKTTLLQNIFWSFFCNEIVRAFSFDCDTCHAKSKKKEQKRLEKSYKKKNYKKKDFTQVVSLSVLYFGAKNCDQISL